jgi:hypothetical protein
VRPAVSGACCVTRDYAVCAFSVSRAAVCAQPTCFLAALSWTY